MREPVMQGDPELLARVVGQGLGTSDRVTRVCFSSAAESSDRLSLELEVTFGASVLRLTFSDVVQFRVPEIDGGYASALEFGEPTLEEVPPADHLERIRVRLSDELSDWIVEAGTLEVTKL